MLGSERRRQDDAVQRRSPATSRRRGGSIRFFGEDITTLPPHERIRRGLRRTYQISQLFRGLTVLDSVFFACRGVSRRRFSLLRPRPDDATLEAARELAHVAHLDGVADTPVAKLSHGQQRQLEIALALAGAPRFILFDEPAAGLSPTERRDLVAILQRAAAAYRLHHHRARSRRGAARLESVTMMHNGRVFKEGTPEEIEDDPEVQEIYLGADMADRRRASPPPCSISDLHVHYGECHAFRACT